MLDRPLQPKTFRSGVEDRQVVTDRRDEMHNLLRAMPMVMVGRADEEGAVLKAAGSSRRRAMPVVMGRADEKGVVMPTAGTSRRRKDAPIVETIAIRLLIAPIHPKGSNEEPWWSYSWSTTTPYRC